MFVFGVALFGADAFWSFGCWATDRFRGTVTAANAPIIRALLTSRIFMLASVSCSRSDSLCLQNDPNTVPRTRTAASAMMQVTITVITISK